MPASGKPVTAENDCHLMTQEPWFFREPCIERQGSLSDGIKTSKKMLLLDRDRFFRGLLVSYYIK